MVTKNCELWVQWRLKKSICSPFHKNDQIRPKRDRPKHGKYCLLGKNILQGSYVYLRLQYLWKSKKSKGVTSRVGWFPRKWLLRTCSSMLPKIDTLTRCREMPPKFFQILWHFPSTHGFIVRMMRFLKSIFFCCLEHFESYGKAINMEQ